MKTYLGSSKIDTYYPNEAVVVIGNFDGVHLGHQSILDKAKDYSRKLGLPTVVFTFNPHPTFELRPLTSLKLLMTYEEKRHQLEQYGIDFCVEEPFDQNFAATSAADFFFEVLKNRLRAKVLIVGEDFAFGSKRCGTLQVLKDYCGQTDTILELATPVMVDGGPVSSSRIRDELAKGSLDAVERLLGHAFFYRGEVIHGDKRGRTIGFPTANMRCEEKFPLIPGVYATSVFWRGSTFPSVTNIGKRPTFHQDAPNLNLIPLRIETHILDQNFDLYGEILEVRFHHRLREEQKFSSIDALKAQIQSDVILAKSLMKPR
jgi:riboflavin kinase/FMN adenylyltransferase